jgi:hypothetical protein
MPKATVNEQRDPLAIESKVGTSWQVFQMGSPACNFATAEERTDFRFGGKVASALYRRHDSGTFGFREYVGHCRYSLLISFCFNLTCLDNPIR